MRGLMCNTYIRKFQTAVQSQANQRRIWFQLQKQHEKVPVK